jgi:hypothetical protein
MIFPTQKQLVGVQDEYLERLIPQLRKLPLSDLALLTSALEENPPAKMPAFQSATGCLAVSIMRKLGAKVRLARWHMVDGRCEHKEYKIGNEVKARIGNIGDDEWLEAWIA